RICPLICYDMRFPVWSRNCNDCDLLLYVANWPEVRRTAWNDLVKGRAHENQCYVVALNRIGTDGRGIPFTGDSAAVGPRGELLWQATPGKEEAGVISLSWDELENYRKKFPQHLDADDFTIDLN
ncbi:MAG: nitrilase-related carbon-nitrogen hydrolase, partial [Flavobacteriales bacterium]